MSLIGGTALALVSLQLAVTLPFQSRRLGNRLELLDRLGIVPGWTFFTQLEGGYDVAIDACVGVDRPDAWQEIWASPRRRPWSWLWYPEKYAHLAMLLAIQSLDRRIAARGSADVESSLGYATILAFCRAKLAHDDGDVRFALVHVVNGARHRRFTSAPHPC